jgi:hypothetical protein
MIDEHALSLGQTDVMIDHVFDQILERHRRLPSEELTGFRGVSLEVIDLGRADVTRIERDQLVPLQPDVPESHVQEIPDAARGARRDDEVVG